MPVKIFYGSLLHKTVIPHFAGFFSPAFSPFATRLFTSSTLSTDNEKSPATANLVSAMGFVAKPANFSCVKSITKICSLQTMHFPESSDGDYL
jgi:hypothetical protein